MISMASAGRVVSSNGCVTKPKGRETGLHSCFVQIRSSSLTGSYVMEMAEQREPYESRGSRTVLGEPGGESPPGHSTFASFSSRARHVRFPPKLTVKADVAYAGADRRDMPTAEVLITRPHTHCASTR